MKATEKYFPVVLFITLYKVVLTFESVNEILKCNYSNESYWEVLSCGTVYYAVQGSSNFRVCGWNPKYDNSMKATEQFFPVVLFIMLCKVVLTIESVYEILKYDHSHDSPFYLSRSFSLRTAPTIWTPGTSYCWLSVPRHSKWIKIKTKPFNRRSPESREMKGCVIQVREIFRITRYPRKCITQIYRDLYGDATLVPTCMATNIIYKSVNFFFEELVTLK